MILLKEEDMPEDVLPLWVADMDFRTIFLCRGCFGTAVQRKQSLATVRCRDHTLSIVKGLDRERHHQWQVDEHWLVKTPGVVFALAMAVKAYTEPGDSGADPVTGILSFF